MSEPLTDPTRPAASPVPNARSRRRYRLVSALAVTAAFSLALWFYVQTHAHPPCCDAAGYWRLAHAYETDGWLTRIAGARYRTYLFPTLLVVVDGIAARLGSSPPATLFALQFVAYVVSCRLLAAQLFAGRPGAATLLFAALACNVFALPYLVLSLSDASALVCFQVWLASAAAAWRSSQAGQSSWRWLAVAAAMAAAAVAIRPAYLWLIAVTVVLALWLRPRGRLTVLRIALSVALPMLVLLPQTLINLHAHGRATPLPVAGLGGLQLRGGIENLKYATVPLPDRSWGVFYANPFVGDSLPAGTEAGVDWYVRHPLRGAATVSTRLVGAFDVDHLYPYIHDPHPAGQTPLRLLSLTLLMVGLVGLGLHARRARGWAPAIGPPWFPVIVFGAWASIMLLTAIELRFALPMWSLLLPLAIGACGAVRRQSRARIAAWIAAAAIVLAGLFAVARFVGAQSTLA